MPVSSVTEHWIKQDAIIINLNHFVDPDYLQVSVLAGAVVMAFKQDVIGYNAARNYRTWPLQAANTFLETTDALNVYARLTRSEVNASALIIYDPLLRDIEGRSISYADDGSEVLGEADEEYYYIYLGQISSSLDSNGNEVDRHWSVDFRFGNLDTSEQNNFSGLLLEKMFKPHYDDKTNPNKLTSIEALAGLWTEQFLSAKGMNSGGGSDEPTGGATTLGGLRNVAADADRTYDVAKMLVLEAKSNLWTLKNLSELVGGLDEAELAEYLTNNNYAKKSDIPSLSGYATEQWVLGKGYLTEHQDLSAYAKKTDIPTIPTKVSAFENDANYATTSDLDNRIDALVNGAPAAYDTLKEIADVLAGNVNSISDILTALGNKADKATTLSGYGITDAYTITQIDSIVNGLSKNISTLQGYFTDGVANSALKLSDNGSYTAWGQTFFTNGKPKSISGALTDVTDITSSGTITTNKIVIGNGAIEWDETNKGFKIVGGLYTETYLSSKGANPNGGSSSGGGLITSLYRYADLGKNFVDTNNDTFNAYTINAIHNRVSVLEGKATNVSFTQSLTSGTQIGSITIDGVSNNIYAPTIPTSDINKGVTAYGWGNHATMGYITASASITGNAASASLIKPTTGTGVASSWVPLTSYTKVWSEAFNVSSLGSDTGDIVLYLRSGVYTKNSAELCVAIDGDFYAQTGSKKVLHEGNYTDYAYSKTTIDSKLGGYLPLSGGTITGDLSLNQYLRIKAWVGYGSGSCDMWYNGNTGILHLTASNIANYHGETYIHSGNIGSQSVAGAAKLVATERTKALDANALTFTDFSVRFYSNLANNCSNIPTGIAGWANAILVLPIHDSGTTAQLFITRENNLLYFRQSQTDAWKGVAFLDSNVASATKLQTARTIWGQSFDGTSDISGYVYSLGLRTNGEYGLYIGNRFSSSLTENDIALFGEKVILWGNNVGIGTNNPQYKLDVNGTLNASGAVSFDSILTVGGATRIDGNVAIGNGSDGNRLYVYGVVRSAAYNAIGNNNAAFVFDMPGTNYTGIGANGTTDTIYFGACNTSGAWITDYYQKWHFNGEVYAKTGVWSDGYVSAKGQNTSSDMRLKNVINEVVLGVKDIANAPSMRFSWKNGGGVDVGSSAQYWQGLLPDAVKERDGMLEMQYANIALLSAIALAKNFETMDERVARLEKENKELRNEISMMKGSIYE